MVATGTRKGNPDSHRCDATTRAGAPCRNWAVQGGRCRLHARRDRDEDGGSGERPNTGGPERPQPGQSAVSQPGPGRPGQERSGTERAAPTLTTFTAGATGRRAQHGDSGGNGSGAVDQSHLAAFDRSFGKAGVRGDGGTDDDPRPPGVMDALGDVLGDDLAGHLDGIRAFLRRRLSGDYEVDEFGLDPDLVRNVMLPLMAPLYDTWWRVVSEGRDNVPMESGGLLVSNHAGTLPFDGLMLAYDVHEATGRFLRELGANLVFTTPFVGHLARKSGSVRASREDADAVLSRGELAGVFPEGFKGLGKPFSQRYHLERFGRGGFVATALRARVPIVPVAIVGSEEIYPMLFDARTIARALGLPYFPIVAQMLALPLLGPLSLLPLPTKWSITYGKPIETAHLPEGAAEDPMVVFALADRVRDTIQDMLTRQVMGRRSVFF